MGVPLAVRLLSPSYCNPSHISPAGHGAGEGGGDVLQGRNVGGKHLANPDEGGWMEVAGRDEEEEERPGGGSGDPSTPGWSAGLGCSRLAAEDGLGR